MPKFSAKKESDLPQIRIEDYRSWSFRDRTFVIAFVVSIAWHLFWAFSITVVVSPPHKAVKPKARLVSLGPVLDDAIFRTLVESRPALSQTFYQNNLDVSPPVEMPVQMAQPHQPGDVVSMPFGKKFFASLRELMSGSKPIPEDVAGAGTSRIRYDETVTVEGGLKNRPLVFKPDSAFVTQAQDFGLTMTRLEFDVEVDRGGNVVDAVSATPGAGLTADSLWTRYLRQWRFAPLSDELALTQKGRVRIAVTPLSRKPS